MQNNVLLGRDLRAHPEASVFRTHPHLSCNGSRRRRPTPPPSWSQSPGTACSLGSAEKKKTVYLFNATSQWRFYSCSCTLSLRCSRLIKGDLLPRLSWRGRRQWGWWWRHRSSAPRPGTLRTFLCTSGWRELWWGWWRSPSVSLWGPVQWRICKCRT